MKRRSTYLSWVLAATCLVPSAFAQNKSPELNNPLPGHFPDKARFAREFAGGGGSGGNLSYHTGGPVLTSAKVVPIFWGPTWSGSAIATSLTNYLAQFGGNHEYKTITQYYQILNGIQTPISLTTLTANAVYDSNNPPTNVTDADIQGEVLYLFPTPATDTVYEVFLPNGTYSSNGSSTSCGGPNLQYCAYHGHFQTSNGSDVKYASMPYPSCSGCQTSGFTDTQNFEHFISHETREAVTDEDLNAWYDRRGYEADDKCAWSPTPFTDSSTGINGDQTPYAYQYEWSNANSGCVKTTPELSGEVAKPGREAGLFLFCATVAAAHLLGSFRCLCFRSFDW